MRLFLLFAGIVSGAIFMAPDGFCQSDASLVQSREVSTLRNALESFASATRDRMDTMQKELDAFKKCAEEGKVYGPAKANSDADGCVESGLSLGQDLPAAPPCDVNPPFPAIRFGAGTLNEMDGRLVIHYSGTGLRPGRCGHSDKTSCTRTYNGESFSACNCSVTKAPQDCGHGFGGS